MTKKLVSLVLATSVAMSMLAGCGGLGNNITPSSAAQSQAATQNAAGANVKLTIKLSNGASASSPGVVAQNSTFKKLVEEASKGTITVQVYSDNQLGDDTKGTEAVRAGDLEMCNTSTAPLVGLVPELAIFDIPFLFSNSEVADKVIDDDIGKMLNEKLAEKGLVNLAWNENGFRDLTNSKKAVTSPSDLAGLKIRTMENQYHLEAWKDMGANPTPMSWSEVFTALQQHTIDGQENPIPNFYAAHIQEVNKYVTLTHHIYSPFLLLYSKAKWDTYDAATQNIISDAAAQYSKAERELNRTQAETLQKKLVDEGCTVTELTDAQKQVFKDKTASVWDSVKAKVGDDMITKLKAAVKAAEG